MAPELAAKFPQFKTYAGHALDDSATSVRFDTTHKGFHAIIFTTEGTVYIDPEHHPAQAAAASGRYKIYFKRQARTREARIQQRQCLFEERAATASRARELTATVASLVTRSAALTTGPELREYRLAVAATGEYTAFHGGTVADGMAAIVTAMNRVNGIYETEVAVRMILVANNDLIVYTNSGTDPYSNNNGSAMLGQNQSNLDSHPKRPLRHRTRLQHRRRRHRGARRTLLQPAKGRGRHGLEQPRRRSFFHRFRGPRNGPPVWRRAYLQWHRR